MSMGLLVVFHVVCSLFVYVSCVLGFGLVVFGFLKKNWNGVADGTYMVVAGLLVSWAAHVQYNEGHNQAVLFDETNLVLGHCYNVVGDQNPCPTDIKVTAHPLESAII